MRVTHPSVENHFTDKWAITLENPSDMLTQKAVWLSYFKLNISKCAVVANKCSQETQFLSNKAPCVFAFFPTTYSR